MSSAVQSADLVKILLDCDRRRACRKYAVVHQAMDLTVGAPGLQIVLPHMMLPALFGSDLP
jgi:hypothetical protein